MLIAKEYIRTRASIETRRRTENVRLTRICTWHCCDLSNGGDGVWAAMVELLTTYAERLVVSGWSNNASIPGK